MANLTESQNNRLNGINYVQGGLTLAGAIGGLIYSQKTGGGFWRGVGYWVLGSLIVGIPTMLITNPMKTKILKDIENSQNQVITNK